MRSSYLIIVICWVFAIAGCGEGDVENIPASTEGAEPPATVPLVDPADLVLFNGSIYTVSPEQPWVEAVAIDDGRYVFIGASSDTGQYIGEGTEVIDLAGRFAMPGINDGHVHVSYGGEEIMFHCKFPFTATPEEIGQTLADCVSRIDGEWIIGGQWTSSFFENFEIESPREFLDEYSGDKAVFFNDDSLHNGWANSRALELASVTHDTPDPDGGSVERDAEGVPNGVLLERATELVERVIPPFTPEQYQQAIRAGLETMASPGVTGFKEANGRDTGVAAFQAVDRQGGSSAHVATSLQTPTGHRTEPLDVAEFIEKRDRYRSENVHTEYIKMFLDGVPRSLAPQRCWLRMLTIPILKRVLPVRYTSIRTSWRPRLLHSTGPGLRSRFTPPATGPYASRWTPSKPRVKQTALAGYGTNSGMLDILIPKISPVLRH